jgi:hypothetical protein
VPLWPSNQSGALAAMLVQEGEDRFAEQLGLLDVR